MNISIKIYLELFDLLRRKKNKVKTKTVHQLDSYPEKSKERETERASVSGVETR